MLKPFFLITAIITMALAVHPTQGAATLVNVSVLGTLGPVLEGSDPLGANGHNGILSMQISESATPVSVNGNSVVYSLPAGTVTTLIGSTRFTTTTASRLTITVGSVADTLSVLYNSQNTTMTQFTAVLAPGSYSHAVFAHPIPFSPSEQHLTPAASAGGPGSKLSYTDAGSLTVLGLSGSISNSVK